MEEASYSIQGATLIPLIANKPSSLNLTEMMIDALFVMDLVTSHSQNGVLAGVYPASPSSWLIVVIATMSSLYTRIDPSLGMIEAIKENLPYRLETHLSFSSLLLISFNHSGYLGQMKLFCIDPIDDKGSVVPFLSRDCVSVQTRAVVSAILYATGLWVFLIYLLRYTLKALLSYHGWIFESHGKMTMSSKVWLVSWSKMSKCFTV